MKILEWITAFIGWLQIVFFPLFIGLIVGLIVYYNFHTTIGLIIGISITVIGLLIGIIMATRIWKKTGTINFLSRGSASPELNDLDEDKVEDKK